MLEAMIQSVLKKTIAQDYPHLQYPPFLYARITLAADCGAYFEYSLTILTATGETDSRFPEIPHVRCKEKFETGTQVVVGLLYGELNPVIVSEVL